MHFEIMDNIIDSEYALGLCFEGGDSIIDVLEELVIPNDDRVADVDFDGSNENRNITRNKLEVRIV